MHVCFLNTTLNIYWNTIIKHRRFIHISYLPCLVKVFLVSKVFEEHALFALRCYVNMIQFSCLGLQPHLCFLRLVGEVYRAVKVRWEVVTSPRGGGSVRGVRRSLALSFFINNALVFLYSPRWWAGSVWGGRRVSTIEWWTGIYASISLSITRIGSCQKKIFRRRYLRSRLVKKCSSFALGSFNFLEH